MNGVLVINKGEAFTSFDVVAVVRKTIHQKKIGHTGTLDPNATGVLPLLIGNATKAQDIIENHDKKYIAGFKLGVSTDTLDVWGKIVNEEKTSFHKEDVEKIIPQFCGEIMQIPPMYSAVQINGQRLYDLARKGIEVERCSRKITVYNISLDSFDEETQQGVLSVSCSKGTYIRTLIDDIGKALGTYGIMTSLLRTEACGFTLENSYTLEELQKCEDIESLLLPTESLFASYKALTVSEKQTKRFSNGNELDISRTALSAWDYEQGQIIRVISNNGIFLGLGIIKDQNIKLYKIFNQVL